MELPEYLIEKCIDVTVGNLSIPEFEKWIYQQTELIEEIHLMEFYFLLLEFNYKQKDAKSKLEKLTIEHINPLSYETTYVLKSLEQLSKNKGELLSILKYLHELHCYEAISFLRSLGNCYYTVEEYIEYKTMLPTGLLLFIQKESAYVLEKLKQEIDQKHFIKHINFETNEPPSFWSYDLKKKEVQQKSWWKKLLNI